MCEVVDHVPLGTPDGEEDHVPMGTPDGEEDHVPMGTPDGEEDHVPMGTPDGEEWCRIRGLEESGVLAEISPVYQTCKLLQMNKTVVY